jgi:plasmid stabilization system protein ParE
MMRKVIWSPEAANDYGQNIDYLLESWSSKEAQVFIDEVTGIISLLQNHNVEFRLIGYKDVRSAGNRQNAYPQLLTRHHQRQ